MCFSAEASFVAAAVLSITGLITLKQAAKASYRWLAAVPLLFGVQQFSEGVLWIYLPEDQAIIPHTAKYIYMLFAYLFWPVWIPFSLYMAESERFKRKIIGWSLFAGIAMTSYFLLSSIETGETSSVSIVGHSIQYSADLTIWRVLYSLIVLVPCFVSSLRGMKVFGVLAAFAVVITSLFYTNVFVSVWCFFAALISLVLYGVLRVNRA